MADVGDHTVFEEIGKAIAFIVAGMGSMWGTMWGVRKIKNENPGGAPVSHEDFIELKADVAKLTSEVQAAKINSKHTEEAVRRFNDIAEKIFERLGKMETKLAALEGFNAGRQRHEG